MTGTEEPSHSATLPGVGLGFLLALTPCNDPDPEVREHAASPQARKKPEVWGKGGESWERREGKYREDKGWRLHRASSTP